MEDGANQFAGLTAPITADPPAGAYRVSSLFAGSARAALGALVVAGLVATAVVVSSGTTSGASLPPPVQATAQSSDDSTSPTSSPTWFPTSSPITPSTLAPSQPLTNFPTISTGTSASPTISPVEALGSTQPTLAPSRVPTEAGVTSVPTASPTTAFPSSAPSRGPTQGPTQGPSRTPTPKPSASPSGNPTKSPSRTTLPPSGPPTTGAPTTSPTVDVLTINEPNGCAQDVFVFLDVSKSINSVEQTRQRTFAQKLVREIFKYSNGTLPPQVSINTFAKAVYPQVGLDETRARNVEVLEALLGSRFSNKPYTAHDEVFNFVTGMYNTKKRPKTARFDRTTGAGLAVVLISDGMPKLRDKSFFSSRQIAMRARAALLERFPMVRIWCFTPNDMGRTVAIYYEEQCDGYWYTGAAERGTDDTLHLADISASKLCSASTAEQDA